MSPPTDVQRRIEQRLLELVTARGPEKTICPSEVVRSLNNELPSGWRSEMQTVRDIAQRLAEEGRLNILQKGNVVPVANFPARGPIRIGATKSD